MPAAIEQTACVLTIQPLPDDPFEVPLASHPEQIHSPALGVIEVTNAALDPRHDAPQRRLAAQ